MRAPPPAGSSAGWARWRAEGCGGRAREAAMLSFPAGGGQLRVALPGAPRPTAASAPPAQPRRLLLRMPRGSVRAGAARRAARSRRLLLPPPHPSPRGARPPLCRRPRVSRPLRARAPLPACHSCSSPFFVTGSPSTCTPLPRPRGTPTLPDWPWRNPAARPRPGLYMLAPGQRAFPSCAWSSPNLRAIRPAQGPHLSTRRPSWSLTLFNTLSGQQEGQVPPE